MFVRNYIYKYCTYMTAYSRFLNKKVWGIEHLVMVLALN